MYYITYYINICSTRFNTLYVQQGSNLYYCLLFILSRLHNCLRQQVFSYLSITACKQFFIIFQEPSIYIIFLGNFHINAEEFVLGLSASLQMSWKSLLKICVLLTLGLQTLQLTPEVHEVTALPGTNLMAPVMFVIKAADVYTAYSPRPKPTVKKIIKTTPKYKNTKGKKMRTTTARMSLFPRKEPPPSTPEPVVVRNPYTMSYRSTDPPEIAQMGYRSNMKQLSYPTNKTTPSVN